MERKSYAGRVVLVTGAGGFLGSHMCRALLAEGAEVHALLRPERDYHRLNGVDLPRHFGELSDREAVLKAVRAARPQVLFHLAACTDRQRSLRSLDRLEKSNITATLNVLRSAAACGIETLVYAGTADEYGRGHPPFSESQQPDPLTPYAASKATGTLWCQTMFRSVGLNCICARLFMVYGPEQSADFFIPQLLASLERGEPLKMTRGEQTRDFTWVGDNVEALLRLGSRPDLGGEIFNICSGQETTLREVIETLGEIVGRPIPVDLGAIPYREGELFRSWGSPAKLLGEVGYRPSTTLRSGLERLNAANAS